MQVTNIKAANNAANTNSKDGVYSATINGQSWNNISATNRFWLPLQAAIAAGATIKPYEPTSEPAYF